MINRFRFDDGSIRVKCRGRMIKVFNVGTSETLTKTYTVNSIIYFSCDEPIAILYKDKNKQSLMDFRSYGEITLNNKLKLRRENKYKTILPRQFDAKFFEEIVKNENTPIHVK